MSDDSSDEDLPLSALGKKEESSEEEAEFEEESEEEEEEVGDAADSDDFIVEDEDEDDDDDDGDYESDSSDDAPISSLKSPKKKAPPPKKAAKAKPAKKEASAKKKAAPKKKAASAKKKKATTKKSAATKSSASSSSYLCASSELYAQCDKGKLIQSLLARWWYAYQWPDPATLPASTPVGYDALDGFPGVYICTKGADVGKFMDRRDHGKSPSFKNFARKGSEELREMLLTAIEEQAKVLVEHEGKGTETEMNLRTLEKWARKLNCDKADMEAEKVLKAKKLKLS